MKQEVVKPKGMLSSCSSVQCITFRGGIGELIKKKSQKTKPKPKNNVPKQSRNPNMNSPRLNNVWPVKLPKQSKLEQQTLSSDNVLYNESMRRS